MLRPVTSSEVWDEETAAKYDADAASQFAPTVLEPTVDYLERLAEGGPALEFAIGTGRVGIPLAARGVSVTGIELSDPMVAQLRRKVDDEQLLVVVGEMATRSFLGLGTFPSSSWSGTASPISGRRPSRSSVSETQRTT